MNTTFSFFNLYVMYLSYRNPECPHILYNEDNEAACCQKDIVSLHNSQRTVISPWSTENVTAMNWDDALAKKAQDLARKCKFKYEPIDDSRFRTGQNMHLRCSNSDEIKPSWSEIIKKWFSEDKVRPNYALSSETGQLTWKKLHSPWVGCGYANYKINASDFTVEKRTGIYLSEFGKDFCQVYVCVYGSV